MNRQHKIIFASLLLSTTSFVCVAAPPPPPTGPPPPPGLPIDSYILYGLVFALLYGAKKIINKK